MLGQPFLQYQLVSVSICLYLMKFCPWKILFLIGDIPIASASKLDSFFLTYNHKKKHPNLLTYLQYLNCHYLPHAHNCLQSFWPGFKFTFWAVSISTTHRSFYCAVSKDHCNIVVDFEKVIDRTFHGDNTYYLPQ